MKMKQMKLANINIQAPSNNAKVLVKFATPLIILGVFFYYKNSIKKAVLAVTKPAADLWVSVTHDEVEATFSGFFLRSRDISDNKIKSHYKTALIESSAENELILNELLTPYGKIKERHRRLIDSGQLITMGVLSD